MPHGRTNEVSWYDIIQVHKLRNKVHIPLMTTFSKVGAYQKYSFVAITFIRSFIHICKMVGQSTLEFNVLQVM